MLLIYRVTSGDALDSAEEARILAQHRALQRESAEQGELHAVARLVDTPEAKTVKFSSTGEHEVVDGPYIETKEWLVGFYLLDCADEAQAIERAKRICPSGEHAIELRPVLWHKTG